VDPGLALPFADRTVSSLTCLHTIEHVGLGRYGDLLDPSGTEKAAAELARVLAPDGALYVTLPIGRVTRTEFNGHRVHSVDHVLAMFDSLAVFDFAVVDDAGEFLPHQNPSDEWDLHYGLGLFAFGR
jgi:SAM-dependent methyltransferase